MSKTWDVIVIGAGQSGLAMGYYLKKSGLLFLILEAGGEAAGAWPNYYESLKLFSPGKFSSLPGLSLSTLKNEYPSRNQIIQYLKDYASYFELPIAFHKRVEKVYKTSDGFQITTSSGEEYLSLNVVCATGSFNNPYIPEIEGLNKYRGKVLHSAQYKNTEPFLNKSVIVVGRGNSAVQIAIELSEVADSTLAAREPISFIPQKFLGKDIHFWFIITGIDSFWKLGRKFAKNSSVIDLGGYKRRIKDGNPKVRKMFNSFYEEGVIWSDGSKEKIDSVIFATGYRANTEFLKDIGVLNNNGEPFHKNGISTSISGLYFVGLPAQRSFASATLRGVGPDANYIDKQIRKNFYK